jgi:hypothetical protein
VNDKKYRDKPVVDMTYWDLGKLFVLNFDINAAERNTFADQMFLGLFCAKAERSGGPRLSTLSRNGARRRAAIDHGERI